jgi:tetratricopeptide (TPR) repeat protein
MTQSLREGILSDPEYLKLPPDRRQKNEAGFREESAVSLAAIGEMHCRLGRPTEAKKKYDEAVAIRRAVSTDNPQIGAATLKLAQFLSNAGNISMFSGELDQAATRFDEAIQLASELVDIDKPAREDRRTLALALFRRGVLRAQQGDPAASGNFADCCRIREDLAKDATNIDRQRELLLVLPRCGKHGEAVALADKILAAVPKPDIELLLDLARAYAQCGVAAAGDAAATEAFQKQALNRLAQAIEAGHRDPVYLQHEPDFEPLRKLERFQAMVAQAKMAADKSAN